MRLILALLLTLPSITLASHFDLTVTNLRSERLGDSNQSVNGRTARGQSLNLEVVLDLNESLALIVRGSNTVTFQNGFNYNNNTDRVVFVDNSRYNSRRTVGLRYKF